MKLYPQLKHLARKFHKKHGMPAKHENAHVANFTTGIYVDILDHKTNKKGLKFIKSLGTTNVGTMPWCF